MNGAKGSSVGAASGAFLRVLAPLREPTIVRARRRAAPVDARARAKETAAMNDAVAEELGQWDAVETAERLRRGDVSPREVIDAAVARAERRSSLGAIVTESYDEARRARPSGALAGVPTFIKDLAQVRGVRTAWGSRGTGEHVSRRSDPSIERLFGTGLVCLGKSATPEFGLTATTEPLGFPPCRNAWDRARSAGGSSGGAACLVAAGVVPLAHASDGGGSIRIPAAANGLVGLKPTRGRFDMDGSHLLPVNVAVQGVVTRTVRDTVAFFAALERPGGPMAPIGQVRPAPAVKLRVGVFTDAPLGTEVHPEHRDAALRAGAICESLGHHVETMPCPFDAQVIHDFLRFWGVLAFLYLRGGKLLTHPGFDASRLEPWTRGLAAYFSRAPRVAFAGIPRLRRFGATYAALMRRFDVLVSPTLGEPPPPLGHLAPDLPFETKFERLVRFAAFTPIQNIAGAPAVSLPLGRTSSGLPIGVQLAAAVGAERTLLELARSLEEAAPWPRAAPST